ncbi:unnamed protein product [Prorocentrum cordatum]|uniref:Uncharacterized protein n=1 Tax=Prorocentrum cordatum TaxID=2364126 RepID=A0ABN9XC96_9DINO|nr:unnamed protein product [Polarella glacialis]
MEWARAAAAGAGGLAQLGSLWYGQRCTCQVELGDGFAVDRELPRLLEGQLHRCGPANLTVPAPCPPPECSGYPGLVVFLVAVLAFLAGFAAAASCGWWCLRSSEGRATSEGSGTPCLTDGSDDPRELLWHERLLCAHVHEGSWVVTTPERDTYLEDLQEGVESLVLLGPMGGLPESLRLQADGAELALQERRDLGLAASPPPPPPSTGAPPPLALEGVPSSGEGGWRCSENRGGARLGERVGDAELEAGCHRGDRGVALVGDVFVACAFFRPGQQMPTPREVGAAGPVSNELRTLPVKYEAASQRHRSYKEAASLTTTTAFEDWPISGPRTAEWLAREIARQELTPVRRHFWWRQLLGLGPSDWGVGEHESLSRLFEYALTYDQLNFGELASLELACRRYQLLEERCARVLIAATAGGDSGHLDNDRLFMGEEGRHGRALVALALESWISQKLPEESAVLKERRMAKGERQLARSTDVAPGVGSGKNDEKPPRRPKKNGEGLDWARDLLPLPSGRCLADLLEGLSPAGLGVSRCADRRRSRRRAAVAWLQDGISTLNVLGGRGEEWGPKVLPGAIQRQAVASLARAYFAVPLPPDDLTASGAWSALRGCGSGYAVAGVVAGEFATYQRGRLALPAVGNQAIDLVRCLPDHYQKLLEDSGRAIRLPAVCTKDVAAGVDELGPAMDPILARSPIKYAEFLMSAYESGVVEPATEVRSFVGVFFVRKKDGSLRIIFDPRNTNSQFVPPDSVALTSPEALGDLELPAGQRLWVSEGDVENCYCQFLLPDDLRADFALPAVPRKLLPRNLRRLFPPEDDFVHFQARVVPMGWSWAVALVQAANAELLRAGPQGVRRWICNRRCAPAVAGREPAAFLYIDNFASLGTVKETVQLDGDSMERQLRGRGLTTRDVSGPQVDVDLLGFHIDGVKGAIHIAPKRFWRLVTSLDYTLKHPLLTGAELERLIGHLTYVLLLRREVLSLLSASCVFVSKCYARRVRLWPSVRRELTWVRALLPLVWADLRGAWAPSVMAVDASMTGLGAVERSADPHDVGRIGRVRGRWRFKEHELVAEGSRARALREGAVGDSPFPDVPSDFCRAASWKTVASRRWRHRAPIHLLEGEALLWAMRRQCAAAACAECAGERPWAKAPPGLAGPCALGPGEGQCPTPPTRCRDPEVVSLAVAPPPGLERVRTGAGGGEALYPAGLPEVPQWPATGSEVAKLLSAVLWARPALGRPLRVVLPRSSRALLGWKRKRPGHSRPPLPWLVLCGVLEILLLKREVAMACALCLMFHCYLRPGELLAMKAFQLVPPAAGLQGGFRWWTLLLHPEELLVPSKTGELGDSLPLGAPELQWLTPALRDLKARLEPREPLWSFGYAQLREELEGALAVLGLQSLGATLHCLRRGGASHDRIVGRRSLEEVAKRGRWRARLSVRRCEKHGRLALQVAKVPPAAQAAATQHAEAAAAVRQLLNATLHRVRLGRDRVAVEVFAGSGRLASALRARGVPTVEWDIIRGAQFDLTKVSSVEVLKAWILSGEVPIKYECSWVTV